MTTNGGVDGGWKGSAYALLVGVQTAAATVESSMEVPPKTRTRCMMQLDHSWAYAKGLCFTTQTPDHPCLLLLYSQQPGNGNSRDAHQ